MAEVLDNKESPGSLRVVFFASEMRLIVLLVVEYVGIRTAQAAKSITATYYRDESVFVLLDL